MSDTPLVALDANAFDRIAPGQDDLARAFGRLLTEGRLRLVVPAGVAAEVAHPNAPAELRVVLQAAAPLSRPRPTARQEIDRIRIRAMLRGNGRPGKHDADAAHLSDAADAGCRFFVTADGKILRRRDTLAAGLPVGLRVVTLAELVAAFDEDG